MSPSPTFFHFAQGGRPFKANFIAGCGAILVLLAILAGCGGGEKEKDVVVLATVGGTEITSDYYEDRLIKLEKNELPRDDNGQPLDMALMEGKEEFLTTLINKEIMVQTAQRLGYNDDPVVVNAREALTAHEANLVMWEKSIQKPAQTISEEELAAFYAKMGVTRNCSYLITNSLSQAETARQEALEGDDWDELVAKYHEGSPHPSGVQEISVPFGRYTPDFENGVYDTEIGGISPVIDSSYGYWVLKVLNEQPGKKPPLEEAKAQILDITYARKMAKIKGDFIDQVFEKFELTIHEDALAKCYEGLPADETLFRDGTQEPRDQNELSPLTVAPADLDMPFYSYLNLEGVKKEYTLLDYKIVFDEMSVFQRPKDAEMVSGLRNKIKGDLSKIVINFEVQDLGYFEDPAVIAQVDLKIEEMTVSKLYGESVQSEETVTADEMQEFWAVHSEEYIAKESFSGRLVICLNAEQAAEARAKAAEGMSWKDLLVAYGIDRDNKSRSGKLEDIVFQEGEPVSETMSVLEPGQLSEPFLLSQGRYGVVRLDSVTPERVREMDEVSKLVGARMREIRKEEIFQAKLAEWGEEVPVVTYPENLAVVESWEELKTEEIPENVVPRN